MEFYPLGVIGAIVSWNYPFHNVFNPVLAAVFSGNAAVIKVEFGLFWFFSPLFSSTSLNLLEAHIAITSSPILFICRSSTART